MAQMKRAHDRAAFRKLIKALLAISFGTILEWVRTLFELQCSSCISSLLPTDSGKLDPDTADPYEPHRAVISPACFLAFSS